MFNYLVKQVRSTKSERRREEFSNHLPWAYIERKIARDNSEYAIVVHKDHHTIQQTFAFRGHDLDAYSESYIASTFERCHHAICRLEDDWVFQLEINRYKTNEYPTADISNLAGYLIDKEREFAYKEYGQHYDSSYYLTIVYSPKRTVAKSVGRFFVEDSGYEQTLTRTIEEFARTVAPVTGLLSSRLLIRPLTCDETVSFLHQSISFKKVPFKLPFDHMFLDRLLEDTPLDVGRISVLGDKYIPIGRINDYPSETYPAMLHAINKLGIEYRMTFRIKPKSKGESLRDIEKFHKKWYASRKGIGQIVTELSTNVETGRENHGAKVMEADVLTLQGEVTADVTRLAESLTNYMVWDEDYEQALGKYYKIDKVINDAGFTTKEEGDNTLPAFLGMMPGNSKKNIVRQLVTISNYVGTLPLSAVWSGIVYNKHTKDVCGIDAPLLVCSTGYGTPFFMSLNEFDVGHTSIFGPTGAGKTTLLQLLAASFLKYPNSSVYIFDKGRGFLTLTLAVGGEYVNPGEGGVRFQPLADIDDPVEKQWAQEFIETLLVIQGMEINAREREAIKRGLEAVAIHERSARTLTTFALNCNILDENGVNVLGSYLQPYLIDGSFGFLFDGDMDNISNSKWLMFEMEELMNMGEKVTAPALAYLFHAIERMFTGNLSLLIIDEAWLFLSHPSFADKIREWLKVLRKKNVFVVFATQEVADAANSTIAPTIIQNTPTKIFLADPKANDLVEYYRRFGLSDDEISILESSTKKQDYFYKSSFGTRLFQLDLGPLALALFTEQKKNLTDKNNRPYVWSDYCQYLLEKRRAGETQGFELYMLERLGVDYEKYVIEYTDEYGERENL